MYRTSINANETKTNRGEIPIHLKEIHEPSCKNQEPDQIEKLGYVSKMYQEVFAKNKMDLGSCSLVKHQIDTCGTTPI